MAERTLKIADRDQLSDDDPFAELTRIMGFDPRQPVSRQEAPDPVMGEDFDIDLEKELMGEFVLGDDDEGSVGSAEVDASPEPSIEPDDLAQHDLDEAVAASMQDFDLSTGDEAQPAAAPQVEFDRDFDDALAQSFEAAPAWPEKDELSVAAGEETVVSADDGTAFQDFEAHFDDALAEIDDEATADIDMDFDLDAGPVEEVQATVAVDPVAPEPVLQDRDIEPDLEFDAPEAVADPFDEAFSLDLGEDEAAAPVVEPVAAAPSAAGEERSLEDELNALLGNMGARIAKPDGIAVPHAWAPSDRPAPAADPFAVAGAGYGSHTASAPMDAVEADVPVYADHDRSGEDPDGDIDFDPADFEAFATDSEAGREAPAPAASPTPIFSRTWSRALPVERAQPVAAADAVPAGMEEATAFTGSYEAEPASALADEPQQDAGQEEAPSVAAYADVPDVETIDVPERVEALADDLDLPELVFEEDRPAATAFDDLDAEFAGLINELNDTDAEPVPSRAAAYDDEPYQAGFRAAPAHDEAPAYAAASPAGFDGFDQAASGMRPFAPAESFDPDPLDYDPELDEAIAIPDPAMAAAAAQPSRRGLIAAAVVGAVVVIGGLGAFALSPGSGNDGAPVLVKADDTPIKVKPENPGGTVVPNQDNTVYEAVAKGIQPAAPEQETLVVDSQQPVNVNTAAPQNRVVDLSPDEADDFDAGAPVAKSEDRIDPDTQQAAAGNADRDVPLVSPRKVRTMIVKPDGTLAPREDVVAPAADVAASEPADPAPQRVVSATADDRTGTVPAAAEEQPAAEAKPAPAAKTAGTQSASTPQTVAAVPQRPSDQPVDVVGEVKPDEVASIAPTAAASGSWSMQIASQPSAEAAQSTYQDLARRYASILDGQPVNIVKAEIAGKGTFYRVRVAANSRNDAIWICESYKAAGGNCFVSK